MTDAVDSLRRSPGPAGGHREASHGEVSFFCRKQFVMLDDHHHGADHLAFWAAAPPGAQEELIASDRSATSGRRSGHAAVTLTRFCSPRTVPRLTARLRTHQTEVGVRRHGLGLDVLADVRLGPGAQVQRTLGQQRPGGLAAGQHHPVDLVELQQADAERGGGDHHGAAAVGGVHGPSGADHHGPQQGLAQGRDARTPYAAGTAAGTGAASHRDVDGDDRSLVALEEEVDGQVVDDAAVHQELAALGRDRREEHGQSQRREDAVEERPATVHLAGPAHQVGAHQRQLAGQPLHRRVAGHPVDGRAHADAAGERVLRDGPVVERVARDELGERALLQLGAVAAHRVDAGDRRPDARAGDPVDGVPRLLELAQHTDVRERPGAAAGEHQPEAAAGQPVRDVGHPGPRVAVDHRQPPGVRAGHPGHPVRGERDLPDHHQVRLLDERGTGVRHAGCRPAPPGRRRPTAAGRSPARRGLRPPRPRRPRARPGRPPPRPWPDRRRRRRRGRRRSGGWRAVPSGGVPRPRCHCPRAGRRRRRRGAGRVARGSSASPRCASGPPPGSGPSGRPAGPGRAARRRPHAAPR